MFQHGDGKEKEKEKILCVFSTFGTQVTDELREEIALVRHGIDGLSIQRRQ